MELITDKETLGNIDSEEVTLLRNKEHLLNMLPHYEFSEESEKRIVDAINNPPSLDFMGIPLNTNSQRAFFKLTDEDKKDLIEEINEINEQVIKYYCHGLDKEEAEKTKRNVTLNINPERDSIKAILQSSKYLVVSRNPIDIIFCSTNQNFGSCYSFDSNYGYCMGVPALIPNKDMFVCYLTKGKHQNYEIKEEHGDTYSFRYMKMLTRFFAYHCVGKPNAEQVEILADDSEKDMLGLGFIYPKNDGTYMNHKDIRFGYFGNLFKKLGLNVIEPKRTFIDQETNKNTARYNYDVNGYWKLKTPEWFLATEKVNENHMNPYFDNLYYLDSNEPTYKIDCGSQSQYTNYIRSSGSNTSMYDKITRGRKLEDIIGYDRDDSCCDEDDENSQCCDRCDDYFNEDDMYWIESRGAYVCDSCYNNYYFECECCSERFHNDNEYTIYEIIRGLETEYRCVCESCRDNYYYCEECCQWFEYNSVEETEDGHCCKNCYEKIYEECSACGERACKKEDMLTNYKGDYVCEDCYQGKMTKIKQLRYTQRIEFSLPKGIYFEVMKMHKGKIITKGTSEKTIIIKRRRENGRYYNTVITINWEG